MLEENRERLAKLAIVKVHQYHEIIFFALQNIYSSQVMLWLHLQPCDCCLIWKLCSVLCIQGQPGGVAGCGHNRYEEILRLNYETVPPRSYFCEILEDDLYSYRLCDHDHTWLCFYFIVHCSMIAMGFLSLLTIFSDHSHELSHVNPQKLPEGMVLEGQLWGRHPALLRDSPWQEGVSFQA